MYFRLLHRSSNVLSNTTQRPLSIQKIRSTVITTSNLTKPPVSIAYYSVQVSLGNFAECGCVLCMIHRRNELWVISIMWGWVCNGFGMNSLCCNDPLVSSSVFIQLKILRDYMVYNHFSSWRRHAKTARYINHARSYQGIYDFHIISTVSSSSS